ncbi:MAG: DNA polymerase III subunit gamma/tau [Chlorobi bacterium]|nr:DNA polymerase III subunit gamma/tau [Chlorobiota bacterium]
MENFIVSARKYRPHDFKSVVGQQSITVTLKNSIKTKQLAHAYLFCGPRGVGKTTCARIFAKTINCSNLSADFEACNECESCKAFNENRSYNIHELDAASNNSVEDIRNLIEQVRIPPQIGTHSVYIIDEVHMLSSQAFNAFLKTLEEPPDYAIFVLATTEKHKIIPTILSRCQIFDFNRIKVEDSVNYLSWVAEQENVEADKDALNIIAQKADGAMRDALSFFDQIVSFTGKKITYQAAIDNLNVLDYDYYFKLTNALTENNISDSLLIFNDILNKGFDGHHFISGLSSHLRDLMVCKDEETVELIEVGSGIKQKYIEQSRKTDILFLLRALDISNQTDLSYKASKNKRLQVELALMKICEITKEAKKKTENINQDSHPEAKLSVSQEQKTEYKKEQSKEIQNEAPKIIQRKSRISINGNNSKTEEKTEQNDTDIAVSETNKELVSIKKAWEEILEKFEQKPRLYNALKSEKLVMTGETLAELTVMNKSLEQALIPVKSKIISFLRNRTGISDLNIIFKLSDDNSENNEEYLYTDRDKFQYLVKKNPSLDKLKKDFDLDY